MLNFVDSIRLERTVKHRKMGMSVQGEWGQRRQE